MQNRSFDQDLNFRELKNSPGHVGNPVLTRIIHDQKIISLLNYCKHYICAKTFITQIWIWVNALLHCVKVEIVHSMYLNTSHLLFQPLSRSRTLSGRGCPPTNFLVNNPGLNLLTPKVFGIDQNPWFFKDLKV